ncbi:hypothetical protein P7C71_g6161, partial [Lecanoromycetidae sp. Uapishka_2]
MAKASKASSMVMAASTAVLAVTGAWYGAGLKEKQEIKQKAQTRQETVTADQIAILEQTRTGLMAKKAGLENKIAQLEARQSGTEDRTSFKIGQGRQF